jgi:hypothetical protein
MSTPSLDITPADLVHHVADQLRLQASAETWGTQEAVSRWLAVQAENLEEALLLLDSRKPGKSPAEEQV